MIPDYEKITEHIMLPFLFWGRRNDGGCFINESGSVKRISKPKVADKMKRVGRKVRGEGGV